MVGLKSKFKASSIIETLVALAIVTLSVAAGLLLFHQLIRMGGVERTLKLRSQLESRLIFGKSVTEGSSTNEYDYRSTKNKNVLTGALMRERDTICALVIHDPD